MDTPTLVMLLVLIGFLIFIVVGMKSREGFLPYGKLRGPYDGPGGMGGCMFTPECLNDNSRTITLANGMNGVCLSAGVACPSFSQDHYGYMRRLGMIP